MGKINETTGALSGLVGTVVISSWRGVKVIRSAGRKSKKPMTIKQLEHQAKVGMISKFVYSMKELLEQTFANFAIKKTGTNAAFSYNFKNAVSGAYPTFNINYSRVLISRGDLPHAANPVAAINGDGELQFNWEDNTGIGQAKATDRCICVAHCLEFNMTLFTKGMATRQSGSFIFSNAKQFKGKTVETWLAFMSGDGNEVSDSVYTGNLVID